MNYAAARVASQQQIGHFSLVIDTTILGQSMQL